jgi:hypothetical protein
MRKSILAAVVSLSANAAYAGLGDAFSDAFNDATMQAGGAGTYQISGRTVHQGGFVRIRVPTVGAPNPVRFQPPSISGGCNGFDIYGGSFSYITADELLDWMNAVIENSGALATYMFITYLQEQCSVCSQVMQTLYAMQDMMNMTMQDSCSTATALVDGMQGIVTGDPSPTWDSYVEGVRKSSLNFSTQVEATYDDAIAAMRSGEKSTANLGQSVLPDQEDRARYLYGGNVLYWIIQDTAAVDSFKTLLGTTTLTKAQLYVYLVAMVGNSVSFIDDATTDTSQSTTLGTHTATISIQDFMDGSYGSNKIPGQCGTDFDASNLCQDPVEVEFKDAFDSVTPYGDSFVCAMTGKNRDDTSCGGDGLLSKLGRDSASVAPLTATEEAFMSGFRPGVDFPSMLATLASSPAAMEIAYQCFQERMLEDFAYFHLKSTSDLVLKLLEGVDMGEGQGMKLKNNFKAKVEARMAKLALEYKDLAANVASATNCSSEEIERFNALAKYAGVK